MSLNYEYHGDNYKSLPEESKKVFHQLPLVMFAAGIAVLDETTIKEFVYRANLLHLYMDNVKEDNFEKVLPVTINCKTLSRKDWIKQKFMNRYIIAEFSEKDAKAADERAMSYRLKSEKTRKNDRT